MEGRIDKRHGLVKSEIELILNNFRISVKNREKVLLDRYNYYSPSVSFVKKC